MCSSFLNIGTNVLLLHFSGISYFSIIFVNTSVKQSIQCCPRLSMPLLVCCLELLLFHISPFAMFLPLFHICISSLLYCYLYSLIFHIHMFAVGSPALLFFPRHLLVFDPYYLSPALLGTYPETLCFAASIFILLFSDPLFLPG